MAFFDKLKGLFGEKEEQAPIELSILEVEGFVTNHSDKIKSAKANADEFKSRINANVKDIKTTIFQLKQAKPVLKGDYPEKVLIVGESIRDNYCTLAENTIKNIPTGTQELYEESKRIFKALNLNAKKSEILSMLFSEFMIKLTKQLLDLKKTNDAFRRYVKKDLKVIKKNDSIQAVLNDLIYAKEDINKHEDEIKKLDEDYHNLQNQKREYETKLTDIRDKKSSDALMEIEEEIKLLEEKNNSLLSDLDYNFSDLRKPLKKLKYLAEGSEAFSFNPRLADEYLKSASSAFIGDEDYDILQILADLRMAIEKDELSLEEKQRVRAIEVIDKISLNYLEDIRRRYDMNKKLLEDSLGQKTQLITPLVFKEKAIEKEHVELEQELKETEKAMTKHKKLKWKLEEDFVVKLKDIQILVTDVTGQKVIISHTV